MNPTPLVQTVAGQCRYPIWTEGDATFPVCGAPVKVGSYCEHHARMCYQRNDKRKPTDAEAA